MRHIDDRNDSKFKLRIFAAGIVLLLIVLTTINLVCFNISIDNEKLLNKKENKVYDHQYVIVAEETNSSFWQAFYQGAKEYGESNNAYIQFSADNDFMNYSKGDFLKMAIAAKVDGIILEGDESEEITELINKAVEDGIPVVTAVNDIYNSSRQSFVGVANYNLGREYGRQIIKAAEQTNNRVLLLFNTSIDSSGKNIVINGINETVKEEGGDREFNIEKLEVNNSIAFSSEEEIRDIFVGNSNPPDIIVCLDELNTISVYQTVVDFNRVDKTKIIGYNSSDIILNAISKGIIFSTVAMEADEMGSACVKALNEYNEVGNVNDFVIMDLKIINSENVGEYLGDEEENKEP